MKIEPDISLDNLINFILIKKVALQKINIKAMTLCLIFTAQIKMNEETFNIFTFSLFLKTGCFLVKTVLFPSQLDSITYTS